jgi:hydrogenase nickel incorporation protein HypB
MKTIAPERQSDAGLVASLNRETLADANVFTISINGGPGCGKTSLIEAITDRLPDTRVGIIACDITSHLDADRMKRRGSQVVQVNTGQQRFADATQIYKALETMDLEQVDLLCIENVGTLTGNNLGMFGQALSIAMFSVAAGDDKAAKHPDLVAQADIVILNKTDLLLAVPFDLAKFRADVKRLNPKAQLFEISALSGDSVNDVTDWLRARITKHGDKTSTWFG